MQWSRRSISWTSFSSRWVRARDSKRDMDVAVHRSIVRLTLAGLSGGVASDIDLIAIRGRSHDSGLTAGHDHPGKYQHGAGKQHVRELPPINFGRGNNGRLIQKHLDFASIRPRFFGKSAPCLRHEDDQSVVTTADHLAAQFLYAGH